MIKKADFIFTVGYSGNTAIINRRLKFAQRNLDPAVLLEAGLFRPAFCSAMWQAEVEKKVGSLDAYLNLFATKTGLRIGLADIQRMFGVYAVPSENLSLLQI